MASVTSLSGLSGSMGVVDGPSVGHAWFELFLLIPTADGVAMLGAAVQVSAWSARAVPAP